MERLLLYVWKYKLYASSALITTEGKEITVIDPGILNTDAGPDFFNAKIKTGKTVWAGSIEIHERASDWVKHHHHRDKAYDAVILHVVNDNDAVVYRSNGEKIPQLILPIPDYIRENIQHLFESEQPLPCFATLKTTDSFLITAWLNALTSERLERKTQMIFTLLKQKEEDWNEVFYILLTRNFGFGLNSDAFQQLADSLPFHYILKHRNSISQVEALFFGQAGLLEAENDDDYYRFLKREYRFLAHKYGLTPLDASRFKNFRTYPSGFPPIKLAQLAMLWFTYDKLFSQLLEAQTINEIRAFFRLLPSDYWSEHYSFRHKSPTKPKMLGENAINILMINTVASIFFAYGKEKNKLEFCERAIQLQERLPAEQNAIIRLFEKAGVNIKNAADSQAVIQLKREYCEKKKCMYCRIGYLFLKTKHQSE
ncbi:MAG: DUF2851 family protein [Massilibacteroides sp.]|nr:DUF2851 family protein [Massilibacteroides sp.]MDD3061998.1 DUF2851 family protein [Massilibacteroides sp.]MDD4114053.1 DUF2851 family protein [Massilibacteroides sp.]MDD4659285.1 DUF2851 family protein [Massilibacteroides sp.]